MDNILKNIIQYQVFPLKMLHVECSIHQWNNFVVTLQTVLFYHNMINMIHIFKTQNRGLCLHFIQGTIGIKCTVLT